MAEGSTFLHGLRREWHRFTPALVVLLLTVTERSSAEVPVLGRWQEFAYSEEEVHQEAALVYASRLAALKRQGQLDDDAQVLARVRRLGIALVREARELKPSARRWAWEIHTTSAPEERAFCMAGGKLLFSSAYIRSLELSDGELATLIGHEVAHAIAEHQREILSQVAYRNVALTPISVRTAMARLDTNWSLQIQLAKLSSIQESEADQLGMTLAHSAGWDSASMVSFYRKLTLPERESVLGWGYPPAAARLGMAETFSRLFPRNASLSVPRHRRAT